MPSQRPPLHDLIARRGSVIVDGAMSTALEALGADLNDRLWSAKVLVDEPELIGRVHKNYFDAGANVAITASYQATEAGFRERGIGRDRAKALIGLSVELARKARDDYLAEHPQADARDLLIAGAVGPYGAYLSDGSEYTGAYRLAPSEYERFHALRLEALAEAGADLLALETQPRMDEIEALVGMAVERGMPMWVTCTLGPDGTTLADGTPLSVLAQRLDKEEGVEALGINCVAREKVERALEILGANTGKPLIVYPNSGETYDAATKTWRHPVSGSGGSKGWESFVPLWKRKGALCIGGCCRTLPADIMEIARLVRGA